ncbi:growth-regulating factor 6-like [Curcuma longa]|uniref:growth-regulating factor 6-like n=1 Tax=Curcuma longa TaxID=136217 RepID=UPI003D9DD295
MDFSGALDTGVSSEAAVGGILSSSPLLSDMEISSQRGPLGSVLPKHERSVKVARPEALAEAPVKAAPFLLKSNSCPLFPEGEQMVSFTSRSQIEMVVGGDGTLPYYNQPSATSSARCYIPRNAGLTSNLNMQGVMARARGPFTPSQLLELEHQALIYKYLLANVPIPATLLVPLRRSPTSGFPLSAGAFSSGGWGSLHLGYSGNADLEPGRCRRTDGKKWRCSRNAVADQKYCERHMNRGRHRSRKHVEGQSCHAAKATPIVTSSHQTSAVSVGTCSPLTVTQQQSKALQSTIADPHPVQPNGMLNGEEVQDDHAQNPKSISMPSPVEQRPDSNLYPFSKQHTLLEGTSFGAEFDLISNGSLSNTPRSSFSDNKSFTPISMLNDQYLKSNPLWHCGDDWSKLAISTPMSGSDFSFSTSSNHDKLALSPLKLSREYNPAHLGLSVGDLNDVCQRQPNWRPISWEASLAGPLGEVLNGTNCTWKDQSKNSPTLHITADDLDSSTRMEFSPTGVLQKTSFASLSSSPGSSPMADTRMLHEGTSSLCSDILGSTLLT